MILLSVILPTCDRLGSLERAVQSVFQQNFENLEIIIMDDSKQDSIKLIKNKFAHLENIKVFRSGLFSAAKTRNLAVHKASGKYITFLDDDDVYMPGRLHSIFSHLEALKDKGEKYSFLSSGRFKEKNNFKSIQLVKGQRYGVIELESNMYKNDIDIGFVMDKKLFSSLGGFDESFEAYEDWEFIIRALKVNPGYKVKRLDYAVNHDTNIVRISNNQHKELLKLANKHRGYFGDKWYSSIASKGDYLNGCLTLSNSITYSFHTRNIKPFRRYLKTLSKR